jgi:hypothetical protein
VTSSTDTTIGSGNANGGFGLHRDDHLWCAAQGFLDLDAALRQPDRESSVPDRE